MPKTIPIIKLYREIPVIIPSNIPKEIPIKITFVYLILFLT